MKESSKAANIAVRGPAPCRIGTTAAKPLPTPRMRIATHATRCERPFKRCSNEPPDRALNATCPGFTERQRRSVKVCGLPGMEQPQLAKRPTRIILVRHGESEGNVDESVYQRKADSKICLTERGKEQARQAGQRIVDLIGNDNVYFYVSPYRRAQQTLYEIGMQLPRERILGVREDARLREQDFGNFQDDQMSSFKEARKRFSRFFFRFRDGESAADVYDRVTTFRETLRNDINFGRFGMGGDDTQGTTVVVVTHGLTLRVFLMRWYKWTVDMFEQVHNPGNSKILVMDKGSGGRYSLAVYHSRKELLRMGLTERMIDDQEWQSSALPGDFHNAWPTSGPSYFEDFEAAEHKRMSSANSGDLSGDFEPPDIPLSPGSIEARVFSRPSSAHATSATRQDLPKRQSNGLRPDADGNLPL